MTKKDRYIHVRVSNDDYYKIKKISKVYNRSMSELIRKMIDNAYFYQGSEKKCVDNEE